MSTLKEIKAGVVTGKAPRAATRMALRNEATDVGSLFFLRPDGSVIARYTTNWFSCSEAAKTARRFKLPLEHA